MASNENFIYLTFLSENSKELSLFNRITSKQFYDPSISNYVAGFNVKKYKVTKSVFRTVCEGYIHGMKTIPLGK